MSHFEDEARRHVGQPYLPEFGPGRRLSPEERKRFGKWLAAEYHKGRSIRELAKSTGRSYGSVHLLLTEQKVAFRRQGNSKKGGR